MNTWRRRLRACLMMLWHNGHLMGRSDGAVACTALAIAIKADTSEKRRRAGVKTGRGARGWQHTYTTQHYPGPCVTTLHCTITSISNQPGVASTLPVPTQTQLTDQDAVTPLQPCPTCVTSWQHSAMPHHAHLLYPKVSKSWKDQNKYFRNKYNQFQFYSYENSAYIQ